MADTTTCLICDDTVDPAVVAVELKDVIDKVRKNGPSDLPGIVVCDNRCCSKECYEILEIVL